MTFYFSDGNWDIPLMQAQYYSKWKDETFLIFKGNFSDSYCREGKFTSTDAQIFFCKCSNWRDLVTKALKKISSEITNKCEIMIYGNTVKITYNSGKLEKNKSFKMTEIKESKPKHICKLETE
jgi:hypothetical protein